MPEQLKLIERITQPQISLDVISQLEKLLQIQDIALFSADQQSTQVLTEEEITEQNNLISQINAELQSITEKYASNNQLIQSLDSQEIENTNSISKLSSQESSLQFLLKDFFTDFFSSKKSEF